MGLRDEYGDFESATLNAYLKPYIIKAMEHLNTYEGIIENRSQIRKVEMLVDAFYNV
jgi:hypothetical protein